jgi:hypothetical protein
MMQVTQIVKDGQRIVLDLPDGNRIEPLSPSTEDAYCVMRGTIPPSGGVPLRSHTDAESFYVLSGEVEALVQTRRPGMAKTQAGRLHPHSGRSETRVAQSFQQADVSPEYLHRETWPRASGDGTAHERRWNAHSFTGTDSASRGNIRALRILARQPRGKRSSRN